MSLKMDNKLKWLFAVVVFLYVTDIPRSLAPLIIQPEVTIKSSIDKQGRPSFKLKPHWPVMGINKVMFKVNGEDEYLWVLRPKDFSPKSRRLVYGEIPSWAIQEYPSDGIRPQGFPAGKTVCLYVEYDYDILITPASEWSVAKFHISEDGTMRRLVIGN